MKAVIDGIHVEGTPKELVEFKKMLENSYVKYVHTTNIDTKDIDTIMKHMNEKLKTWTTSYI